MDLYEQLTKIYSITKDQLDNSLDTHPFPDIAVNNTEVAEYYCFRNMPNDGQLPKE